MVLEFSKGLILVAVLPKWINGAEMLLSVPSEQFLSFSIIGRDAEMTATPFSMSLKVMWLPSQHTSMTQT